MEIAIIDYKNTAIAKVSSTTRISSVQDATDLLGNASYLGADRIMINENNLAPEFFDLSTKLAGEILQKVSNYHKKLVIIGEFEKYSSEALKAFILECNRGAHIFFVDSEAEALEKLV